MEGAMGKWWWFRREMEETNQDHVKRIVQEAEDAKKFATALEELQAINKRLDQIAEEWREQNNDIRTAVAILRKEQGI
jgi:phosphopantothenate synthetase